MNPFTLAYLIGIPCYFVLLIAYYSSKDELKFAGGDILLLLIYCLAWPIGVLVTIGWLIGKYFKLFRGIWS